MSKAKLLLTSKSMAALALTFAFGCAHAEQGSSAGGGSQAGDSVKALCLETVHDYFIAVDANDADAAAALFTDDASVTLAGTPVQGAAGVREYFQSREAGTVLRHHLTTFRITATTEGRAKGDVYAIIHGETTTSPEDGEPQKEQGMLSGIYRDEYLIDNGACKILKRSLESGVLSRF